MNRLCTHAALLILLCISVSALGTENCCVPIRLDITAKVQTNGRPLLAVKLTNTGAEQLRFSMGSGPWAGPGQIRLIAMKLPGGEPIDNQLRAMVDPALGPVDLAPGKSMEYDVPVEEIYHELAAELRRAKNDVVLFWTYELTTWDSKKSERLGGWLLIRPTDLRRK